MEAIKEAPVQYNVENVKPNAVSDVIATPTVEASPCYASNGVAETTTPLATTTPLETTNPLEATAADYSHVATGGSSMLEQHHEALMQPANEVFVEVAPGEPVPDSAIGQVVEHEILSAMDTDAAVQSLLGEAENSEAINEEVVAPSEAILSNEVTAESSSSMIESIDASNDKFTLRTEVLVEKSEDDVGDPNQMINNDSGNGNDILNDLGQGIELSEALRSSDTADHVENNNDFVKEEVFNKEELLDILEGNDNLLSGNEFESDPAKKKMIESEIALKQLSRLQKKRKATIRTPRKKKNRMSDTSESANVESPEKENKDDSTNNATEGEQQNEDNSEKAEVKSNDSILHTLVKEWDDDEPAEGDQSGQVLEQSQKLLKATEKLVKSQEIAAASPSKGTKRKSVESPAVDNQNKDQNKSGDESQPPRARQGRVIKKKVPFDPDNPDTFTKSKEKLVTKIKEPQNKEPQSKEPQAESKEQPSPKKAKQEHTPLRPKSKSPVGAKQQWKKPTAKNGNKNNKRLTEVDKLLMDEGAVNMIYQLTPEAPKGKKNMRTKAEFIKKLQSSTPDGKEMKFRERKKEAKSEEREAKKILGGKSSRSSMSGSIKSPSAAEDFETHSADDSIIYRRHSSSSYSSACMSPRRLSDVETGAAQSLRAAQLADKSQAEPVQESAALESSAEMFMADTSASNNSNGINKDDCISIKEKLNTKLSLALNKKKRESIPKTEKPAKQKRAVKTMIVEKESPSNVENIDKFKQVSVRVEQRLVEICIRKTGSGYSFDMLKELEQALQLVDSKKGVSVILLTSECGTLCSNLDLRPLLGDNMEIRTNYAHSIAEAVRSLLCTVEKLSKLVVSGVWGACTGAGLALAALSDVCLATDQASFSVSASPPLPGTAVLTARCSRLSRTLINDLLVFGRGLSASEALQGGLVSRSVPGASAAAGANIVRAVAKELASEPAQNILLKKQLLKLNRSQDSMTAFLTGLEKERDLLVEYWTSVEGQDTLHEVYSS